MPAKANPQEITHLLNHYITCLWDDPHSACLIPPLMIWGAPGVGKSAVVRNVAQNLGIGFVDIRLAQREPVDMRGLPVPDGNRVKWLVSSDWPDEATSRGIIFFDELTAADRTLQAAAYEIILDRRLGDLYQVPDGWYIAAAGNRAIDQSVSVPMSAALANRFCHVEMTPDSTEWLRWARKSELHPAVLGFISWRPDALFDMPADSQQGWASPRSWERVSYILNCATKRGLGKNIDFLNLQFSGLIGKPIAIEFAAFLSQTFEGPSAEDILIAGMEPVFPSRADQRYALTCALVHVLRNKRGNILKLWPRFLEVTGQMTSDFAALAMEHALEALPAKLVSDLMACPGMAKWTAKHGIETDIHQKAEKNDPHSKLFDVDRIILENI